MFFFVPAVEHPFQTAFDIPSSFQPFPLSQSLRQQADDLPAQQGTNRYIGEVVEKGVDYVTSGAYGIFKESREVLDSPSSSQEAKIVAGVVSIISFCFMLYKIGEALDG